MSGTRHEKYPLRKSQAFVYIYRKTKNINGLPGPWIYRTTNVLRPEREYPYNYCKNSA
jgi:hypothetical protein